jgi:hypothetical protein
MCPSSLVATIQRSCAECKRVGLGRCVVRRLDQTNICQTVACVNYSYTAELQTTAKAGTQARGLTLANYPTHTAHSLHRMQAAWSELMASDPSTDKRPWALSRKPVHLWRHDGQHWTYEEGCAFTSICNFKEVKWKQHSFLSPGSGR